MTKQKKNDQGENLWRNPLCKGKLRNLFCPCKSGKKVKKCCGIIGGITVQELNRVNRNIKQAQKEENESYYADVEKSGG
tara:strand:+ start:32297 stop:32533 length:237 start_codon:yes stop_codon:yes gene_type:complete